MKKLLVMALTGLSLATLLPVSAQAATQNDIAQALQSKGYIVKATTGNPEEIKKILNDLGIDCDQIDLSDCPVIGLPGTPDTDAPEDNTPETTPPAPEVPDTEKPETTPPAPEVPDTETPETPEIPDEDTTDNTYAQQVVNLVNAERAKAGLSPLTVNNNAAQAALVRAKETEVSFSHTRPDGRSFSTALTESGAVFSGAGENIAWGQKSPEEVMKGWMNSDGHRANILNAKFTSIGVGHYQNAKGVNYWTQLFMY